LKSPALVQPEPDGWHLRWLVACGSVAPAPVVRPAAGVDLVQLRPPQAVRVSPAEARLLSAARLPLPVRDLAARWR
jgi:hypothetical protein